MVAVPGFLEAIEAHVREQNARLPLPGVRPDVDAGPDAASAQAEWFMLQCAILFSFLSSPLLSSPFLYFTQEYNALRVDMCRCSSDMCYARVVLYSTFLLLNVSKFQLSLSRIS